MIFCTRQSPHSTKISQLVNSSRREQSTCIYCCNHAPSCRSYSAARRYSNTHPCRPHSFPGSDNHRNLFRKDRLCIAIFRLSSSSFAPEYLLSILVDQKRGLRKKLNTR